MYAINALNSSNNNHIAGSHSPTCIWCHCLRGFNPHMDYNHCFDSGFNPVAGWSCGRN